MALVITRREGEALFIGEEILVRVEQIRRNSVRISIDAPKDVIISREELGKPGGNGRTSER